MNDSPSLCDVLQDLEVRHDDLLTRLDDLDRRIQGVLHEWAAKQPPAAGQNVPDAASLS